jgi:O-methyltransferase
VKLNITEDLYHYVLAYGTRPNPILDELKDFTLNNLSEQRMLSTVEQVNFMMIIAKLINAKKYLEIGTFVGYSALAMAIAMGHDSSITTLDISQPYIDIATNFWQKAQVDNLITPIIGDASNSLDIMVQDRALLSSFDIAFIDGNKSDYLEHYEYCYQLVRHGGLIIIDNTLMSGKVILDNVPNYVNKIKLFNQFIHQDNRVDMVMLPFADGITMAYKKY